MTVNANRKYSTKETVRFPLNVPKELMDAIHTARGNESASHYILVAIRDRLSNEGGK